MKNSKIYGICLDRLSELIGKAKVRMNGSRQDRQVLLESYNTGNVNDIVYILDLYDLEEHTYTGLIKELEFVASSISEVMRETLTFGYCESGHLGLYLAGDNTSARTGELAETHG